MARAVAAGVQVRVLVRQQGALEARGGLTAVVGDARELGTAQHAVEGVDAVVSAMAIVAGTEPTTDLSDATRAVVVAMEGAGVERLVVTANTTVFHAEPVPPPFAVVAEEHRRNLAMLRESRLDWTMLAANLLDDEDDDRARTVIDGPPPATGISRAAFSRLCLEAVDRDEWIHHVVGVSR